MECLVELELLVLEVQFLQHLLMQVAELDGYRAEIMEQYMVVSLILTADKDRWMAEQVELVAEMLVESHQVATAVAEAETHVEEQLAAAAVAATVAEELAENL